MPRPPSERIAGIHHVTAIAGDAQANLDFYAGVLGLRLVKQTVNYDDPGSYHFYFGDELGHPGTLMTFFPWPGAPRGRIGAGQVQATAFAIPAGAERFWSARLKAAGVQVETVERFGDRVLAFDDPDGLHLELVAAGGPETNAARGGWADPPIEAAHAIRGLHSVTLLPAGATAGTIELLGGTMAFVHGTEHGDRVRLDAAGDGAGAWADVIAAPRAARGRIGSGVVHHVAWRATDDDAQRAWQERLIAGGIPTTEILDRQYFRSIYFREPGGILFEIATDPPGFTTDESPADLGVRLRLPAWLEASRPRIEAALPPIRLPAPRA